ncbi:hypothetical protein L6V77_32045 [Myxococcota bacterium]|nr:hypothetical protein [Myxococcota bacterium]
MARIGSEKPADDATGGAVPKLADSLPLEDARWLLRWVARQVMAHHDAVDAESHPEAAPVDGLTAQRNRRRAKELGRLLRRAEEHDKTVLPSAGSGKMALSAADFVNERIRLRLVAAYEREREGAGTPEGFQAARLAAFTAEPSVLVTPAEVEAIRAGDTGRASRTDIGQSPAALAARLLQSVRGVLPTHLEDATTLLNATARAESERSLGHARVVLGNRYAAEAAAGGPDPAFGPARLEALRAVWATLGDKDRDALLALDYWAPSRNGKHRPRGSVEKVTTAAMTLLERAENARGVRGGFLDPAHRKNEGVIRFVLARHDADLGYSNRRAAFLAVRYFFELEPLAQRDLIHDLQNDFERQHPGALGRRRRRSPGTTPTEG